MKERKPIISFALLFLLTGFSISTLPSGYDAVEFEEDRGNFDIVSVEEIEMILDLSFKDLRIGSEYYKLPEIEGCFYRSVSPGYSIPYLVKDIPITGDINDLKIFMDNPEVFRIDPVPFPEMENADVYHCGRISLQDRFNYGPDHSYSIEENLIGEGRSVHVLISPIGYSTTGTMTFYSRITVKIEVLVETGIEEPDILQRHKPTGDINYLIITSDSLKESVEPFAEWKSMKGEFAHIETVEDIRQNYSGRDDPEKIRNFISDLNSRYQFEFLFLAGDYKDVPIRETKNPKVLLPQYETDFFATDLYYACVDPNTTWDRDGDSVFGEVGDIDDTHIDMLYGRLAIHSPIEMKAKLDELIEREKQAIEPEAIDDILFCANSHGSDPENYVHCEKMIDRTKIEISVNTTKIYADNTGDINFSPGNVIEEMERSHQISYYMGHGFPDEFDQVLDSDDVESMDQDELGGYLFAMSCLTGWFDDPSNFRGGRFDDCLGEAFTENTEVGFVGYSGSNRLATTVSTTSMMGDANGLMELTMQISKRMTDEEMPRVVGALHSLAVSKFAYMFEPFNDPYGVGIRAYLSYNFFGDPEAPLFMENVRELNLEYELSDDETILLANVLDSKGKPVKDVNVTLYRKGELGVKGVTGSDGKAKIMIPPNNGGVINITAYKAGDKPDQDIIVIKDRLDPLPIVRTDPIHPDGQNSQFVSLPRTFLNTDESAEFTYSVNNEKVRTCNHEVEVFLREGENEINIMAEDLAGHRSKWYNFVINIDLTDPELKIVTNPREPDGRNGWFISDVTMEIIPSEEMENLNISIDGGNPLKVDGNVTLIEGSHNYTIRGKDLSGREVISTRTMKLDREKPSESFIDISSRPDGENGYYRTIPTICFRVQEEDALMEYRWDGGKFKNAEGSIEPEEGIHLFEWRTIDTAGNIGPHGNITFKIDTNIPDLETIVQPYEPDGKEGFYKTSPEVRAISVDGTVLYSIVPLGENSDWLKEEIMPLEGVVIEDGLWSIHIRSKDEAGNVIKADRIDLRVDTSPPRIEIETTPRDPDPTSGWFREPVLIEPTLIEKDTEMEISLNGEPWKPFRNPDYLYDGIYNIRIRTIDFAGNINETDLNEIKIDTTHPEIDSILPVSGSLLGPEPIEISWKASDSVSKDLRSFISVDKGEWNLIENGSGIYLNDLSEGDHNIVLKVMDEAGNHDMAYTNIVVDRTAPTIISASPSGNDIPFDDVTLMVIFSEDMLTGPSRIKINGIPGNGTWINDNSYRIEMGKLSPGEVFNVTIEGVDLSGNIGNESFHFTTKEQEPNHFEDIEENEGKESCLIPLVSIGLVLVALGVIAVAVVLIVIRRRS